VKYCPDGNFIQLKSLARTGNIIYYFSLIDLKSGDRFYGSGETKCGENRFLSVFFGAGI
jgi:hypothetical protein